MRRWTLILLGSVWAFSQQPSARDEAGQPPRNDTQAWDTLQKGLQDNDAEHRKKAVVAAGTMRAVPQARRLVENALRDKDALVRQQAAATLGEMGSSDAIPALQLVAARDHPPHAIQLLIDRRLVLPDRAHRCLDQQVAARRVQR